MNLNSLVQIFIEVKKWLNILDDEWYVCCHPLSYRIHVSWVTLVTQIVLNFAIHSNTVTMLPNLEEKKKTIGINHNTVVTPIYC